MELFTIDYTLRTVALGAIVLGIFSGALGSFAVVRKQSLLGDAMAHAALPGVALAFIFTLSKEPAILLGGAIIAGLIGTVFMLGITQNTVVKKDAALGIILSVFFGFGVVLLTFIQRLPTANKAGIDTFLFGNASTLIEKDVIVMASLGIVCLAGLLLFWKEFKLLSFDPGFAKSIGLPTKILDVLVTSLIVIAIVIGLQTVGVVLMSAMIIAPAVAARQWTQRLSKMVFLAAFFGAVAGLTGALLSASVPKIPTGPTIVVFISIIVIISLLFAPARGLLWDYLRIQKHRKRIDVVRVMMILQRLSESHNNPYHAHDIKSLQATESSNIFSTLRTLKKIEWVQGSGSKWALTPRGLKESKRIVKMYMKNAS